MEADLLTGIIARYMAANFTISRRMNAIFRDAMPEIITQDQYSILQYIRDKGEPSTSSELADSFCVGKSTITAIITRLEDKCLIERVPDKKDRRITHLVLTSEGSRLTGELEGKIRSTLEKYLVHFKCQEAEDFLQPLEKLAYLLVQPDEGRETEK